MLWLEIVVVGVGAWIAAMRTARLRADQQADRDWPEESQYWARFH